MDLPVSLNVLWQVFETAQGVLCFAQENELPILPLTLGAGLPKQIIKVPAWMRSPGCCSRIPLPPYRSLSCCDL